ncbi:hypothetical protein EV361DRAFT_1010138 [Lentinula raphanica]|nr:hypothetical protein EV361DRAFT_1010138 [Lentinula raphanica]
MSISVTPDMILRRTISGGVYDTMIDARIGNNSSSLARVDLGIHFKKNSPYNDSDKYVGVDGREFVFNYIGEVAPGFVAHAIGSYTGFSEKGFTPANDAARIKLVVPTVVPTSSPPRIKAIYHNQLATLTHVMAAEEDSRNQGRTKPFTNASEPNGVVDTMYTSTRALYVVDKEKRAITLKVNLDDEDADNDDVETTTDGGPAQPHVGDLHPCSVIPGYGGPRFNHSAARAIQLDIRDPEGGLIGPQDTWRWIVPGALILVHATMHTYHIKAMTIFQLTASSIQVIDKGDIIPPVPAILGLPDSRSRYIGGSSVTPSNGGNTMVNFAHLMKSGPSQGSSSKSKTGDMTTKHARADGDATGNETEDIFESVSEDIEMPAAVDEKQKKVLGKKARREVTQAGNVWYNMNLAGFQPQTSFYQRDLDLLCGQHNSAANVDPDIEAAMVDSIIKAGCHAMSISIYELTFFRSSAPWQLSVTNADVWGYTNASDSSPFRPLLTGYLTRKYIRLLNVGCGINAYTVYELGWSSSSSIDLNNAFRFQRDTLASVIPQDNDTFMQGPFTCSFIQERWCCASPVNSDLTTYDTVKFVLARDCVIKCVKANRIWMEFQAENYNACQDMAIRTGNVHWMDAKRTGDMLSAENRLQENILVSIKAELREVVVRDNLTRTYQRNFCLLAHEVYVIVST